MSRKPRIPGACGGVLSAPRRATPMRSRVGGNCESCGGTGGGGDRGGESARRLRGASCDGRSLRDGGAGGRGRGAPGWAEEGCGGVPGDGVAEDGGAASPGFALGRVVARNASPARARSPAGRAASPDRDASRARWAASDSTLRTASSSDSRSRVISEFTQRWLDAAQLRDQRGACPFVERTAALAGSTGVQSGNGAGDQRVVISHLCSTLQAFR